MYTSAMQCQSRVAGENLPLFYENPAAGRIRKGKEKDIYDFGDVLLLIAHDNMAAFGERLGQQIRGKGRIVTQLSAYWFRQLRHICPNHLISLDPDCFPPPIESVAGKFDGQVMLVWKTDPLPIRCVVRGYLAGAGWREYLETGEVCGNKLPSGLKESQRLPTPIFTPTTKGKTAGQNENIPYNELQALLGETLAGQLRETSLQLYFSAWKTARERDLLIADTKFEFGLHDGRLMLIDECLTPETSRFWQVNRYRSDGPMPSLDKQILADFMESLGSPEMIPFPEEMLSTLADRYCEAYKLITGKGVVL